MWESIPLREVGDNVMEHLTQQLGLWLSLYLFTHGASRRCRRTLEQDPEFKGGENEASPKAAQLLGVSYPGLQQR